MPQREFPTSETPEGTTFDVDARADKILLEVLHSSTFTRVGQLLEGSHDKPIGVTLQQIRQDLVRGIFDFEEYNIRLRLLPQEIQNLIVRTAYLCGKATGNIFGDIAVQATKEHHLNGFNSLISPKDAEDLTGALIRFETHGRIERVLSVIQAWKESQVMPTSLDWEIIHDHIDLFYTICEKHGISEEEAELFLDTFRYTNY